jgi:SAM-dependent methyltransferase
MRTLLIKPPANENRSPESLYKHYLIEKELAERLRCSGQVDRINLYGLVYNELFRRVPDHPQLTRVKSPESVATVVREKMALLSGFLSPEITFLELGAGDCRLAMEVAKHVRQVYAVDVSDEITKDITPPENFRLLLSNGTNIPAPPASVNIAYSYQLMEHVHPDDTVEQLHNLHRVLAPGGMYICITPNRLTGPHDISRYFDREATGFHLKEYTIRELVKLFRHTGFDEVYVFPGAKGRFVRFPVDPITLLESVIGVLPWRARKSLVRLPIIDNLLHSAVVAVKRRDM